MRLVDLPRQKPWGLKWRSSLWFITAVVGISNITDLLVYSLIVPVMPFRLEQLHYPNVSALTGWLLSAFSIAMVVSTLPVAIISEAMSSRRTPLLIGLLCLLGAQVLLMETSSFTVMVVARVLQGISSSVVSTVGLALLCDTTPPEHIGRQMGFATTGLFIGLLAGVPAGGLLFSRFGIRAPFIFGEICTLFDLILRSLIIERSVALKWGYDPAKGEEVATPSDLEASVLGAPSDAAGPCQSTPEISTLEKKSASEVVKEVPGNADSCTSPDEGVIASPAAPSRKCHPVLSAIAALMTSSRAGVALVITLMSAVLLTMEDPTLPLRLQDVWGFNSGQVGLVYIASIVPTLISSPLAGMLSDKFGPAYVMSVAIVLAIPWCILLILKKSVALFIVASAMESVFLTSMGPPVDAELAAVARSIPGVGYAHVYGAFNLITGIGSIVGAILAGQVYTRVQNGWTVLCFLTAGSFAICLLPILCWTGDDPPLSKFLRRKKGPSQEPQVEQPTEKEQTAGDTAVQAS